MQKEHNRAIILNLQVNMTLNLSSDVLFVFLIEILFLLGQNNESFNILKLREFTYTHNPEKNYLGRCFREHKMHARKIIIIYAFEVIYVYFTCSKYVLCNGVLLSVSF